MIAASNNYYYDRKIREENEKKVKMLREELEKLQEESKRTTAEAKEALMRIREMRMQEYEKHRLEQKKRMQEHKILHIVIRNLHNKDYTMKEIVKLPGIKSEEVEKILNSKVF